MNLKEDNFKSVLSFPQSCYFYLIPNLLSDNIIYLKVIRIPSFKTGFYFFNWLLGLVKLGLFEIDIRFGILT